MEEQEKEERRLNSWLAELTGVLRSKGYTGLNDPELPINVHAPKAGWR